jgi:hypothetical protein
MIDRRLLLTDLQGLLRTLEADLLERTEASEVRDVGRALRAEYDAARSAERTALSFEEWRSDAITQVAAAWVLSAVFVRFLEDNGLIEPPRLSGPGDRLALARDEHESYFRAHPAHTDRDYLLAVFDSLAKLPGVDELFGRHNPIRDLPGWLSGDAAGELLRFFQRVDPDSGTLVHDFTDPSWDTRFLGDLYQDLSEAARKKYALLQTPVFIEEFILDRTLDPALDEFGLANPFYESRLLPDGRLHPDDRFRMIDPACGSGHFLLGSFARLLDRWLRKEPGTKATVLVQRALDSVHGVDLNPYAVAIARFRLLLAALRGCGVTRLKNAPAFTIHLACGDSLLHGRPGGEQLSLGWTAIEHVYQPEDREALERLLRPKTYHAVVANPPYITPKDAALNRAYRERYATCHMKYSLAVPFLERIVALAVNGGFTGQITANSFMKREFGKKLIEEYFPRVDLTHVIDTSGAYIPGHGTPTVILLVRNRKPVASTLRTMMGIRGEPSTPGDPVRGLVWSAIVAQVDEPGSQSEFVSVGDSPRELFHRHPWSIGGGGAAELKMRLDEMASSTLGSLVESIGPPSFAGVDDMFFSTSAALSRARIKPNLKRSLINGDVVRDWTIICDTECLVPYDQNQELLRFDLTASWGRYLWPRRIASESMVSFNKQARKDLGEPWWSWYRWIPDRLRNPISIVFAFVATHNHFVLDRGGKVFKQSAPVIKLQSGSTEDYHFALLGLLNSSTTCFWMKQVMASKSSQRAVGAHRDRPEEVHFEMAGTSMEKLPIPFDLKSPEAARIGGIAASLSLEAANLVESLPSAIIKKWNGTSGSQLQSDLLYGKKCYEISRKRMAALQEELDWETYRAFGLTDEGACSEILTEGTMVIEAEDRPFLWKGNSARESIAGSFRPLYNRRRALIQSTPPLATIEQPVFKRLWLGRQGVYGRVARDYNGWVAEALWTWLLDRLESYFDFDGRMNDEGKPTAKLPIALVSVGRLADVARQDHAFHEVGALYRDDEAFDVSRLVAELVEAETVPLLPVLRYKPTGLRKRAEWEAIWILQRNEDALDARTRLPKAHPEHLSEEDANALKAKDGATIPVPPKYSSADFLQADYWRLRGKLDVPKERWVSFPHCEAEDGTLLVVWAGYDHLQLARAISAHYVDVLERLGGRDDPRLVPLLACIVELLPWLKQWHNDIDPEFNYRMGDYFEGFLQEESRNLGLTLDAIKAWQPPQRAAGRGRRRAKG